MLILSPDFIPFGEFMISPIHYSLLTNCDTRLVSSWFVPHVGQEMFTLSGTPDFIPFGDIYSLQNLTVLGLCLRMNGLFAWISLTTLSRTYIIMMLFYATCVQCVWLGDRIKQNDCKSNIHSYMYFLWVVYFVSIFTHQRAIVVCTICQISKLDVLVIGI